MHPKTEDFFIPQNTVTRLSEEEAAQSLNFLQVIKAVENTTYQSMYVIDYLKKGFDYVSDNRLFLCGHTPEEFVAMGYDFYMKHVPQEDLELLLKINEAGFKFYEKTPLEERRHYSITYDFHLIMGDNRKVLVNHKYTPLFLTNEGQIWKALCLFSLSNKSSAGNVQIQRQGSNMIWVYNEAEDGWESREKVCLTSRETEILVFASQGLSVSEIAAKMCVTSDTVKFHHKNLFEKLEVVNISQAVAVATSYKLV
ncbi:helix-turn-helix transcriptional regulator [Marnyiella aurantia]|uniref:Helix-turn-helix transcriptional regulator n=2 Tax=Marnyiella aurantia TaxID=2758037 RepID=A0A7D7LV51_9FLAO|nr:helix-turn-helix transcriptional regulator [Marnyiella aurantia]QMS99635.1 helix-turn-helix transcriptional regulator [Marnyiella aurantia]